MIDELRKKYYSDRGEIDKGKRRNLLFDISKLQPLNIPDKLKLDQRGRNFLRIMRDAMPDLIRVYQIDEVITVRVGNIHRGALSHQSTIYQNAISISIPFLGVTSDETSNKVIFHIVHQEGDVISDINYLMNCGVYDLVGIVGYGCRVVGGDGHTVLEHHLVCKSVTPYRGNELIKMYDIHTDKLI